MLSFISKTWSFYSHSFSGLDKQIWVLATVMLINRSGMMVLPFLTLYVTQQLEFSIVQAGMIAGSFGAGSLVGSLLGGWLTDRMGSKKVMAIALAGAGIGIYILLMLTTYWPLMMGMFLVSMIGDMLRPAVFTAVANHSTDENQTRSISLIRLAINLGISIGPALGGIVAGTLGYYFLFIIDGTTCVLAAVYFIKFYQARTSKSNEEDSIESNKKSPWTDLPFLFFLVVNMINLLAFFQILSTVPLYLESVWSLNEWQIGLFFTLNGLIIFLFEMPIVYGAEQRWKSLGWTSLGAAMIGLGHFCLNIPMFWLIPFLGYSLMIGFGEILNFPFSNTIALERGKKRSLGKYMGIYTMMFSTGFILAPIIGTRILEAHDFTSLWIVMGGLNLLSAAGFYFIDRFSLLKKNPMKQSL